MSAKFVLLEDRKCYSLTISVLLVCDAASLRHQCPTFPDSRVVSSSTIEMAMKRRLGKKSKKCQWLFLRQFKKDASLSSEELTETVTFISKFVFLITKCAEPSFLCQTRRSHFKSVAECFPKDFSRALGRRFVTAMGREVLL